MRSAGILFLRYRLFYFVFLCVISIVMLLSTRLEQNFFRNITFYSSNFVREFFGIGALIIEDTTSDIQNMLDIRKENAILKRSLEKYQRQIKSTSAIQFENKMLRDILQFSLSIDYEVLPAQIIAEGGNLDFLMRIVIDRGAKDGIKKNMAIITSHNNSLVIIGKVTDVSYNTAQFIPITDDRFFLPVQTISSKQNGILSGKSNRKNLLLFSNNLIYNSNKIFVGEEVVVNQYSKFFPRGIPVGEIAEITYNKRDSLLQIYIKPYANLKNLDYVFAVIPKSFTLEQEQKNQDKDKISDEKKENVFILFDSMPVGKIILTC